MLNVANSTQKTPSTAPAATRREVQALGERVAFVVNENATLREHLGRVQAMLKAEDAGWQPIGADASGGMSREDIEKWSEQIREAIVGNPWIKSGIRLRNSYVFQDGGIRFENVPDRADGRSGATNVQSLIDDPINQAHFFGLEAHKERETANYTDGNVYYLGDDATKQIEHIPLQQIDAEYRNPDNPAQIWAYRRRWTRLGEDQPRTVWYYTDTYKSKAVDTIVTTEGEKEPVDRKKTLFDGKVNTQAGWALGVPDALAALIWARIYVEFMTNGKIMTDALAQFAFQASVKTNKGGAAAGLQLSRGKTVGATAVTGGADQLVPLSSAGKGYDFGSGVALLAAVASSIGVSVIHLSSDPGTAGSSYGSASTLDLPTLLATNDRRDWHAAFDLRVLRWMGAPKATAYFKPLTDSTQILRLVQAYLAAWNAGLYEADDMRAMIDGLFALAGGKVPEGVMLPNNEKYVDTLTNDGQSVPKAATSNDTDPSADARGTGKATGTGSSPKPNDLRSDQLAQALQSDEIRNALMEILDRLPRS